jgi:hypothetical protein
MKQLLVAFFFPLERAMAIPGGGGYYTALAESADWLRTCQWPKGFHNLSDMNEGTNFVGIKLAQVQDRRPVDTSLLDVAFGVASEICGHPQEDTNTHSGPSYSDILEYDFSTGSVAICLTAVEAPTDDDLRFLLSDAFDNCVSALRDLEKAYVAVSRDFVYRLTSRQSTSPLTPMCVYDPSLERWEDLGVFGASPRFGLQAPIESLSPEQAQSVEVQWTRIRQRDPFVRFQILSLDSERSLQLEGDYSDAVIKTYMAIEVFLDTLWIAMAWEEINYLQPSSTTIELVVGWFSRRSTLDVRLTNCFRGRLYGWDTENNRTPAYRWRYEVAPLRHRIVHAGHEATEQQAGDAIEVCSELVDYIKELIAQDRNRNLHPRTTLMLLGVAGLIRRGKFAGKVKRLVERDDEENWVAGLVSFRDQLDQVLGRVGPSEGDGSPVG